MADLTLRLCFCFAYRHPVPIRGRGICQTRSTRHQFCRFPIAFTQDSTRRISPENLAQMITTPGQILLHFAGLAQTEPESAESL